MSPEEEMTVINRDLSDFPWSNLRSLGQGTREGFIDPRDDSPPTPLNPEPEQL